MPNQNDAFSGKYTPVDTDLVDNLENFAVEKTHVRIMFKDHTGTAQEMRGKIGEVFTKKHEEFLKMEDGRQIRLDQIQEVRADAQHFGKKSE